MKKFAFTLTELLIGLTIVGVVAILTIPNVTKNIFARSNITKMEATYKILDDAVQKMFTEEHVSYIGDTSLLPLPISFFYRYLSLSKQCGIEPSDCFAPSYKSIDGAETALKDFMPNSLQKNLVNYAILVNGASVGYIMKTSDKSSAIFLVDVNGKEVPNVFGRDLFSVYIDSEGNVGTPKYDLMDEATRLEKCKDGTDYGQPCVAHLQANGWELDY